MNRPTICRTTGQRIGLCKCFRCRPPAPEQPEPTQHQLIEQCAIRLRGIVEALDNIHDSTQHRSPHRWSTDLDDVHSSAESLLAMINDQAPAQDAQGLALRTIAEYPCPEQDNMTAANMRQVAADAITGALAFGAQASQPPAADHWLRPFYGRQGLGRHTAS